MSLTETPNVPEHAHINLRDVPKPGRPGVKIMARWASGLLVAAWCLFLLAWVALYGFLLPHVAAWKPEIEARAGAALGVAVRIGDIQVPSSGWIPTLVLSEVTLLDEQGRPALRLPRVSASVSPRSLLSLQLRFEQLLIEDAALEIRRDREGRIRVAGLVLEEETTAAVDGNQRASEWLLAQGEFAIRRGQVRWVDERRQAPPLVLRDVDFVLRNGFRRHDWRLDATPPQDFGPRWSVRGRFRHGLFVAASDWRSWVGELYGELPRADIDALRAHVDLPAELLGGRGAARIWLDVDRGRLRGATADVVLQDVSLRWPGVVEPMVFARFNGRLLARQEPQSVTLALQRVGFTTGQGQTWPASDMRMVLRHEAAAPAGSAAAAASAAKTVAAAASWPAGVEPAEPVLPVLFDGLEGRVITGGEFSAAELDLSLMASVAARAPLGAVVHQQLASLAPQGHIQDMKATWDGPLEAPRRYRVNARLEGLRLEPGASPPAGLVTFARPGLRGATIQLEASETGGRADVVLNDGQASFPGLFEQADIAVQEMRARLSWSLKVGGPDGVELRLAPMTVRNADVVGELQGTWRGRWSDGASGGGVLDLTAQIQQARAEALHRYLPTTMGPATRDYLRRAVRGGRLLDVTLRIKGDLASFPYTRPGTRGEFRVSGNWRDGTLLMVPEEAGRPAWPEATRVDARLRVSGQRLEFSEVRGRVLGVEVLRTSGQLDWQQPAVPLQLDLQARGPAQDFLRYVQATPINNWTARALAQAQSTGSANLSLKLELPLAGTEPAKLRGQLQLNGNDLRLVPSLPSLQAARGRVDFSERGFGITGGSAQMLGGEVVLDGGIAPGGTLRLNLQGTAQAAAIRAAPELSWLLPVSNVLKGQAPYRVSVGAAQGQLQWLLTSPLSGMGIDLPAPLAKPAAANWATTPLRVELSGLGLSGGVEREQIDVQLGPLLQARFVRNAATNSLLAASVGVGVAEAPALPRSGTDLLVATERLDLDEWRAWFETGAHADSGVGAGAGPARASPWTGEPMGSLMPLQLRLRADTVRLFGRRLDAVSALLSPQGPADAAPVWRADLQATQLAGRVEWRPAVAGAADAQARLVARLTRLSLPPNGGEPSGELPADDGVEWPALDIVVDDLELRGRRLGRLELSADVQRAGRDWRLRRLVLTNSDAVLTASGTWAAPVPAQPRERAAPRRTSMDFELELKDSGALLTRLGFEQALRAGSGRITGQVGWQGSPLWPDVGTMRGRLRLDMRDGQFLKADPGAARLLGVLSLQSLPRRLVLDFRDVFQEGFPFDVINGDVTVEAGVARTNNLRMRGIQAAVLMDGSADINSETQDLRVLVVPEINAGTASLAYATINPALGLGTFLAQLFLRRPLMVASTREFSITGNWAEPKVERLQRSTPLSSEELDRAVNAAPAASAPQPSPNPAPRNNP